MKQVKNGKLYMIGSGDDEIPVVHVWGSAYEMGYAHGELMNGTAAAFMNGVWSYIETQVEQAINGSVTWLPQSVVDLISELGLDGALDLTIEATRPWTGEYFREEVDGLSAASGVHRTRIMQIHMLGELTKGACSMLGASRTATPTGSLVQVRALDWDTEGPFKNFRQITVYHPKDGHAFANVGWTGWIGSITGMSSAQLGINEIGVSFPDDTFGKESRFGIPFTFILRDILQFDNTLEDSMKRITNAHRTCNLILGVGDGKANDFRGIQYSHSVANFFTWDNMMPQADWHPHIQDVVYYGMDWLCPGYNQVLGKQANTYHGNITAQVIMQNIVSIVQTGDLHVAVYDYAAQWMYVANARKDGASGPFNAYDRPFVGLDMAKAWAEPAPSM